jgi:MoaA/NifB/PqqE/SkfB family radical SAM enzyme
LTSPVPIRPYVQFARRILRTNVRRPSAPYKLTFSVTNRCNYRCRTCGIWRKPPADELSLEEIRTFLAKSPPLSWVHLTGGEPFLRPDFVDLARAVAGQSRDFLMLNFPTNGYLTEEIVEGVTRIAESRPPLFFITVSMDGPEEVNDRIRGVKGGWRRQIETFKRLRAMPGVKVALGMTLSKFNLREFDRAFESVRREIPDLRYRDFHVNIAHIAAYYGNDTLNILHEDTEAMIGETDRYRRKMGLPLTPTNFLEWSFLRRVAPYLRTGRTPLPCHALSASCFMDASGTVFPCTMWDRSLGNIRDFDYDLDRLWNNPETLRIRGEIREGNCPNCWTPCEAYQSVLGNLPRLVRR